MKLLHKSKLEHAIVDEVKEIKINPLYETAETFQRNIRIITEHGETLDLILYADEREKLQILVPPEVYKGKVEEEDEYLS